LRFAKATNVNDGDARTTWNAGKPTPERPAWVAVDIGRGPTQVLFSWSSAGSFNYEETDYGSPGSYRIETSGDSTDGTDGSWAVVVNAPKVRTHGQAHSFAFAGRRWIRLVVTGAPDPSPNGVQIDEIEVRDVSRGVSDAWFFMGDSITALAFGRPPGQEAGFAATVQRRHPSHAPAVINGGVGGDKSDEGVGHIDEWLRMNKDARFWCVGYGTNDAAGDATDTAHFRTNLESIVDRTRRAGRIPILATIPFASDGQHRYIPRFNEELRDGVHPTERGIGSINRLWADAVDVLYSR
jgi:lysophospholipase L1-like esterase